MLVHALSLSLALLSAAPATPPVDVFALAPDAFTKQASADLAQLRLLVAQMTRLEHQLDAEKTLFTHAGKEPLSPNEKQTLLSSWGALFAYFTATEALRERYWNFVTLAPTDARHPYGFAITHTALTAILSYGLQFADRAAGKKQLETLLDEANPDYGVPAGAFAAFKFKAIHVATATQLMTGDAWAPAAQKALTAAGAMGSVDLQWAFEVMRKQSGWARESLLARGPKLFLGNALDIAKDTTLRAIFPVQKNVAEWMGDTRVARVGKPLISGEVLAQALALLEPGDVVVVRQNWFLSNLGLPGFWPHAELHVGSADQLKAYFDEDPQVLAWVKAQPEKVDRFSALLERRHPARWKRYATGQDFQGHQPIRVIESISEGVSLTAAEHAFGADYLGVMRPRSPKLEKARAIERAFQYEGRPYDFDFDFDSDSTLVCTELVWKAYAPSAELKGLAIPLVEVAGRRTLPANELVRRFDAEYGTPQQQLDFVAFIDGSEKTGTARLSDVASFRKSHRRLKWDIAQK